MSRTVKFNPVNDKETIRELVNAQPDFREITSPGSAGDELKISHGLGRVPSGYVVVQRPYAALNHGLGDADWTKHYIYLKFSTTDTALTIAVF